MAYSAATFFLDVEGTAANATVRTLASAPTAGGTGYTLGDELVIASGNLDATCVVASESGGVVTAVTLTRRGSGYTTGTGKATTGGTGTGCTLNISAIGNASDAVRASLLTVTFANPSGSIVRATKVAHGLVTGAVVTVSATTNWNGDWKITRVDADNFDLDGAVWAAGADNNGTVVPFGGSSWDDAWATITLGPTAARIAPGDTIRIAKSPILTALGNATWTDGPLAATQTITSSTNATPVVVTKAAHGYLDGDLVQVTGHATNTRANGTWVVANKTANTFELAGSVGNGVGGATGTLRKVSNKVVYLDTAQTKTVDRCELVWTVANASTVAVVAAATDAKEGEYAVRVSKATYVINTLYAYKAMAATDFSAYQKLSFWIKGSVAILATHWKICLCSDAAGAVIVDTFVVPALPGAATWQPLTLVKSGGGNLGASIQSIAIYTGTVVPTAASNILVDNFIACTSRGLSLTSLISKDAVEQGGTEGWFGIQSINDRIVMLDNSTATTSVAVGGRGYSGETENVATYMREGIKTPLAAAATTAVAAPADNGTLAGGNITYSGGWDPIGGAQDGESIFDGTNGFGHGLYLAARSYVTFGRLSACRYTNGISLALSVQRALIASAESLNNNTYGMLASDRCLKCAVDGIVSAKNNATAGLSLQSVSGGWDMANLAACHGNGVYGIWFNTADRSVVRGIAADNNGAYGIYCQTGSNDNIIRSATARYNLTGQVHQIGGPNFLVDTVLTGTETGAFQAYANGRLWSHNHDLSGYHWCFTDGGTINSEATDRVGGTGSMWRLTVTSSTRASDYPLDLEVAQIAVSANNLVTVKAWLKKSHATNVVGRLVCRGGQIAGVTSDVVATKASDTAYEELTITFTPTEDGVVAIEVWAEYATGTGNVLVEDLTITQA